MSLDRDELLKRLATLVPEAHHLGDVVYFAKPGDLITISTPGARGSVSFPADRVVEDIDRVLTALEEARSARGYAPKITVTIDGAGDIGSLIERFEAQRQRRRRSV